VNLGMLGMCGRICGLLAAVLTVSGCGSESPQAPSATDYTGRWHLAATGTEAPYGVGDDFYCPRLAVGDRKEYVLALTQDGGFVTGVFAEVPAPAGGFAVNVNGSVAATGQLTLNGSLENGVIGRGIRITADRSVRNIAGTIESDRVFPRSGHPLPSTCSLREVIVTGARLPLNTSWSGAWVGNAVRRGCTSTPPGAFNCASGTPSWDIDLRLAAGGRTVTGTLFGMPVRGSVDGDMVTLEAESTRSSPYGTGELLSVYRVRVRATQDRLGRLNGALSLEDVTRFPDGTVMSRIIEAEMQVVARYE
jgi:hypothetical protein